MKNQILALKSGRQTFARSSKAILLILVMLGSLSLKAQTYQPSSRTDYVYPPFPTAYNGLHQDETKYLSNASYPSIRYGGDFVFASGWSNDVDGGFTAGTMDAAGNYTGTATVQLLDKIDVQVGFLESSANTYIVVSYFNNTTSNYGFSLYFFNSGTVSHIYDYEFRDPTFPNLPASAMSTMAHNRISMDVNKAGDKVAFTLTDGATQRMFGSVGILDAVNHRIILNTTNYVLWLSAGPFGGCDMSPCPWPAGYDPSIFLYDTIIIPPDADPVTWPYPIEMLSCTSRIWVRSVMDITNPLIEIQAQASFSPRSAIRYQQLFPEVSFSGDNLNFAFYCPGARVGSSSGLDEIYIIPDIPFMDFFTQTGTCSNAVQDGPVGIGGPYSLCYAGVGYMAHQFIAYHTNAGASNRNIRDATGGGGWAATPPLTPSGDMRFNMDMPDDYSGKWAVTLKNEAASPGLNQIEARYNDLSGTNRSVFVNSTPFNTNIAGFDNDYPDISYNDAGDRLNLVWGSEGNRSFTTNRKSLLGVVITPTAIPALSSAADYLVITEFPDLNFGSVKVLSALSKRTADMSGLYTSFCQTQDDLATLTFSIFHNQHNWASSVWRTTGEQSVTGIGQDARSVTVGPNPFQHSIRLLADQGPDRFSIGMFDQVGKRIYNHSGTATEINQYFDHKLGDLSSGLYLIKITDQQGKTDAHKLLKK